jgi:G protein-coupled receptor 157
VSWGIPAVIVIWFSIANFFGLKHESTPGWCSIITTQNVTVGNATQRVNVIYPVIVGYAVFVYLAFVILPVCYITIKCYIRILIKRTLRGEEHSSVEKIVDLKMIFIPLIFIILRIWSLVVDSVKYFSSEGTQHAFSMSVIGQTLILAKVSDIIATNTRIFNPTCAMQIK